jgi:hypothetical protein
MVLSCNKDHVYGVITWTIHICQQTLYFMSKQNIQVDYHFVRKKLANKSLDIRFISSKDQVSYGFTKALLFKNLDEFKHNLHLSKV